MTILAIDGEGLFKEWFTFPGRESRHMAFVQGKSIVNPGFVECRRRPGRSLG
jgi:hypothetical protein